MTMVILSGPRIPEGESLSNSLDCTRGRAVRLTMPTAWTPAILTFQVSTDGGFFHDVHDHKGNEIAINVTPNATVILDSKWGDAIAFLKCRSGSAKSPIVQEEDREFSVVVKTSSDAASPETPVVASAQMETTKIVNVVFSAPLDQTVMPVPTSFVVSYNGNNRDTKTAIFFNSTTVQLTVNQDMTGTGECKVSYLTPTSSWLRGVGGVAVESFSNYPVALPVALR